MTDRPDLRPAARLTGAVVAAVSDKALDRPTPCPDFAVRDLLMHIDGLSQAFAASAGKDFGPMTDTSPEEAPTSGLADGWREQISVRLDELAAAWRDPTAWDGMTRAGGVDLPGEIAGLVALNEVVVHGWDLATATGQHYEPDAATAATVHGFLTESRTEEVPESLFGPVVEVPEDAPVFDRSLGLAGRDPAWRPS